MVESVKAIVKGCCLMPLIKKNPTWHIVELLDGFQLYESVLEAHEICTKALIISLKEESNSSHVNQGYDQLVAKYDKKNAAESLYGQRRLKISKMTSLISRNGTALSLVCALSGKLCHQVG
jgi:hypothetical protein